ncbi:hypothetical protein C3B55_00563 [Candidatus Pseudomonas adelgestsugas]|uniref:Uncharacterized protein n=1 Tax=Candidatus Pseudomonas adelgestsugas TaxID=1302376 RepID=A0ABX5R8B8_9PSED|nr:hypothetical protein C3B55_00563 [Candidatus Pseudomonas adelgestsugas]
MTTVDFLYITKQITQLPHTWTLPAGLPKKPDI